MRRLSEVTLIPILIGLVTIVTYGLLFSQLGFYRDDWYLLATAQSEGLAGIVRLFQIDRPLLGYLYAGAYRLLGVSPLLWQMVALALRLAGNLVFLQLLRMVWPTRSKETFAIALLFAVYPGYSVQPNAGVYSTDLAANAAALVSIVLMLAAMRSARPVPWIMLTAAAGVLELLYLGIFESAIGMEVVRLAIAWYVLWQREHTGFWKAVWRALWVNLPYVLLALAFLAWRLFIFQSTRRATNLEVLVGRYSTLPVRSVLSVGIETLKDVFETTILAWTVPFYQFVAGGNYRDLAVALVLAVVVMAAILMAARRIWRTETTGDDAAASRVHLHMLAIGAVAVLFTLLPIDLAGRNVLFADQWDRYTLYASSGVALLVGGAAFRYLGAPPRRVLLIAFDRNVCGGALLQRGMVPRLLDLAARSLAATCLARACHPERDHAVRPTACGRLPGGVRDLRSRQHDLLPGAEPADRWRRDKRGYRSRTCNSRRTAGTTIAASWWRTTIECVWLAYPSIAILPARAGWAQGGAGRA